MYYGGDYNPEQWPEEVWHEDVALMRQAGVNLVTVGVFAWSRLEPSPGVYDFGWLDRVMDLLHEGGIQVDLATPTASPPPWMPAQARNVTASGVRLAYGSRDTYCVHSPVYREHSRAIVSELVARYGTHPALAMWHVHNEYGSACHCEHAAEDFRTWLEQRHGTLEALNDAWTTAFWSQRYSSWQQITPPLQTQWHPNPAHVLDWRRFRSDAMLEHFLDAKRLLAPTGKPVTTNYVFGPWVDVDHWAWSREVDVVAVDHYPSSPDTADEESAFAADLARSWAAGKPWMLMEQAAGVVYSGGRTLPKAPGELATHSLRHVAAGASGVLFFQWRASRGGAELWHHGMVPHAGADSRTFREVCDLGRTLGGISSADDARDLLGLPPSRPAQVAIVWDDQAWWSLQSPSLPSPDLDYWEAMRQAHRVLSRRGITIDFVSPSADFSPYRMILVPCLPPVSDADAARLRAFPGTLVVSFFSGVTDEHNRVRLGGHPGAFRERLGVRVDEFRPLAEPVKLSDGSTAAAWSESVELRGASAVVRYPDGTPAITRNGDAWYVSTRLDDEGLDRLLFAHLAYSE
ncbi:beta-galactosidase [Nonomuraea soli]|uniref:beta-galactosidase n=1 Tax=Nonomuraea soli TaxID=1032476 RepID=A0A7W0HQZ7_9ACTN|nr:beta-galactosidase [Nonomuraea soli]MBA2892479.1 beta-galactosidase [Nonomuraea soli]